MTQRAVLVGINYYGTNAQLSGCINDVNRVADVLRTLYNFPSQNIVFLVDNLPKTSPYYPTKANILRELATLKAATQPGDIAMFHYSGHGATARNGTSTNIHYNGTDNVLIPTDVFFKGNYVPGNEIIDDELWAWSSTFPEGSLLFSIVDACHSGTALDLPYALKLQTNQKSFSVERVENRPDTSAKIVMLSGCKDNQTSLDARDNNNSPIGALTYAFCDYVLHHPTAVVNYFDFLTFVRSHIVSRHKNVKDVQEPQLSFGRIADTNTQFTLAAPSKTRSVTFDDTLLKSLIATLENPPPTQEPPRDAPAPEPMRTPAAAPSHPPPLQRAPTRHNNFQAALLARKR
jgi:hypothetical protein